jgi:hypothetical protein
MVFPRPGVKCRGETGAVSGIANAATRRAATFRQQAHPSGGPGQKTS